MINYTATQLDLIGPEPDRRAREISDLIDRAVRLYPGQAEAAYDFVYPNLIEADGETDTAGREALYAILESRAAEQAEALHCLKDAIDHVPGRSHRLVLARLDLLLHAMGHARTFCIGCDD